MKITSTNKLACKIAMCFLISNVPHVLMAEAGRSAAQEMIPTNLVLADLTRAEAEKEVRDYLADSEVKNQLMKQGVSPDEVSQRLANLSEQELKQLAGQVKEAKAGGDILVAILLVVLIIFLIKRI